jgi:hypothetical protein
MICPPLAAPAISISENASIAHPSIVLGDVADLSRLPPAFAAAAGRLPIANVTAGDHLIDGRRLLAVLRARMPLLACYLPTAAKPVRLRVSRSAAAPATDAVAIASMPWRVPPAVKSGDTVELRASAGAVRIVRNVEALQTARPGGRLFVRDQDGKTFPITLEGGSE